MSWKTQLQWTRAAAMHLTATSAFWLVVLVSASAVPSVAADSAWMQGFPPPAEQRINRQDFSTAPKNRWSLQHIRELQPTREVWRGASPVTPLPVELKDIGTFSAPVRQGRMLSLDQFLNESHTDGFVILHRGKVIFERYMNGQQAHTQHLMFSATKSFVGMLLLTLAEEGKVDLTKRVADYVPELRDSAFGDATVQQVLDMTTSVACSEIYDDPDSDIARYGTVFGLAGEPPADYSGPLRIYDYLPTLKKQGTHGEGFHYVTPNTDVLGWIIRRVTNKSVDVNLSERLWQRMGVERDGYIWLDGAGTEMAGGGLNITARDAARVGQMILQEGRFNGQQIIPQAVATRILQAGDSKAFTRFYQEDWYKNVAYAYHDQWWTFNNPHKAVSAIGIHGQYIYIDPKAGLVVVKQSSSPDAEGGANDSNDTDGPLLYYALARHLTP